MLRPTGEREMKSEKVLLEALETIASDDWDEDEVLVKASNPDGTPVLLHPSDIARRALDAWGELQAGC